MLGRATYLYQDGPEQDLCIYKKKVPRAKPAHLPLGGRSRLADRCVWLIDWMTKSTTRCVVEYARAQQIALKLRNKQALSAGSRWLSA